MDPVQCPMDANPARSAIADGCPKYLALAKNFERQLRAGVLKVGDRLPSIRQFATRTR